MSKEYIVKITDEVISDAFDRIEEEYSPEQELVRCKDCRFSYYASNRVPTEQTYSCSRHGLDVAQDWFCADGIRR